MTYSAVAAGARSTVAEVTTPVTTNECKRDQDRERESDQRQLQARATTETAVRRCVRSTKEPIATNPSISKDS